MSDVTARIERNERFLKRLMGRRPKARKEYEASLQPPAAMLESTGGEADAAAAHLANLETIVNRERPVLFVQDDKFNTTDVTKLGIEAIELVKMMEDSSQRLLPLLPFIGRFDVAHFPGSEFLGTGWFVDTDVVVTNRHVASLVARQEGSGFVFRRGVGGEPMAPSLCNAHEFDDLAPDASRVFAVTRVLYIEPESGPNDIAFVRVARRTGGGKLSFIPIAPADAGADTPVCTIGYPARAPKRIIPDQELMGELYRGRFDVKRAAPGYGMGTRNGFSEHDCTTLGGNSGSVVLDYEGRAVGLHFAGLYLEANYAVPASVLREYVSQKRWNRPIEVETGGERPRRAGDGRVPAGPSGTAHAADAPVVSAGAASVSHATPGEVVVTIPLTIRVGLGTPTVVGPTVPPTPGGGGGGGGDSGGGSGDEDGGGGDGGAGGSAEGVQRAAEAFWDARPDGVIGVRVGYFDDVDGDRIGDEPCIAASVRPADLDAVAAVGPAEFRGVSVRYLPADVAEQVEALPGLESVDSIAYDDDNRTGPEFALEPIEEEMDVLLHVGPEHSWDTLKRFLNDPEESKKSREGLLVSAMYEFHAAHIKDALEKRLKAGGSIKMVLDNATFSRSEPKNGEFDRAEVFAEWAERFGDRFQRIVAPEGRAGLISDSYHIKVTVRPDDTFWLSSGNWKGGSSQPIITAAQLKNAANVDLPGNREWHVVIRNKTLAARFRNHIAQDFARSVELEGSPQPEAAIDDVFVDVAVEQEAMTLERRPPGHTIDPLPLDGRTVKVQPLLTPDRAGKVFTDAVLKLIRSARKSLLFQIPYISMPSNPRERRGNIDDLLDALVEKLTTLKDARVILRSGGKAFSSPSHAAWYFKSKGVDIDEQVHVIDNHHTKGMIVDGRRVLIGSHNWSKPGVSLNRDASLVFDDADVATYYADAFEVDWARSNPIKPRRAGVTEAVVLEAAAGAAPRPGFRRVRLSDLLKDD